MSRITVRQAMAALEKDGLITRRRGKGSFVTESQTHLEPMKLTGMIEDIIAMGVKTKTRIINIDYTYGSVMEDATESIFVFHIAEADFDRIQNAFSDL